MAIAVQVDSTSLRRALRRLSDTEGPRLLARALNRVAFDVLEAEQAEARRSFPDASSRGQGFLAGRGSFRFNAARPDRLEAQVFPNPATGRRRGRREEILEEHRRGAVVLPNKRRLSIEGSVAVPLGRVRKARGQTGRVPAEFQMRRILRPVRKTKRGGLRKSDQNRIRAFVAERGGRGAILFRPRPGSPLEALYALVPQARLEARFDFYRAARDQAVRSFPEKVRRELEKLRLRG